MTYGVPYSFVPGTKAKADEVNANFIDVLSKIEDTNTRIDDSNSTITSGLEEVNEKIAEDGIIGHFVEDSDPEIVDEGTLATEEQYDDKLREKELIIAA